jgi:hypothetical protein
MTSLPTEGHYIGFWGSHSSGCEEFYTCCLHCSPLSYINQSFGKPIAMLGTYLMPVSCLAYPSAMKIEGTCSSEMSVEFQQATWHCIPEDRTFHRQCCENLTSYNHNLVNISVWFVNGWYYANNYNILGIMIVTSKCQCHHSHLHLYWNYSLQISL